MLLTLLVGSIFLVLIAGLIAGAVAIRRRQKSLKAKRDAIQLQRRADHLFKIAVAAQVHTRHDAIARELLVEAVRVLEYSLELDPNAEPSANLLRECHELLVSIEAQPRNPDETRDPFLEFPETELIEAQLHLTEATRLLIGLEKRGQISYDALSAMTVAVKQAQRAIDLRLQLVRAAHSLNGDRSSPKLDEAALAGEYLAAMERNRVHSSH